MLLQTASWVHPVPSKLLQPRQHADVRSLRLQPAELSVAVAEQFCQSTRLAWARAICKCSAVRRPPRRGVKSDGSSAACLGRRALFVVDCVLRLRQWQQAISGRRRSFVHPPLDATVVCACVCVVLLSLSF